MLHIVKITEKLSRHIIVDTESADEAIEKARQTYICGDFTLDYDDFDDIEFKYAGEPSEKEIMWYESID